ncbi:MAG TPA: hypothetical protein VFA63_14785 [Pseudonocardiaceae bacterium]|jgi:hypothetical protein|nr:hypothetical protein [Pseudonocardiaceae bacterium]
MTIPDQPRSTFDTAQPGAEHDPEVAESYAASVGVDPSHDEIQEYLKMAGAPPLTEQADTTQTDDSGV